MGQDYKIERLETKRDGAWHDSRCRGFFTRDEWQWLLRFMDDIRPMDARELAAAGGVSKEIMASIDKSEGCWRVSGKQGEPLVLFGKTEIKGNCGRLIWCMATQHLGPYEREFARVSKRILQAWADKNGILYNACGSFNYPAIRWLAWCGAKFGEKMKINGEEFLSFVIRGK